MTRHVRSRDGKLSRLEHTIHCIIPNVNAQIPSITAACTLTYKVYTPRRRLGCSGGNGPFREVEKPSKGHGFTSIERIFPSQGHDHGGLSWPKAILPCARAEPTGDSSAPLVLDPHFLWHRERDPHLGLSWAFDQLPVRRPPAIRKGHFPALPCLKQEEPNWAQPTTIRSPLTSAHPTCAVSRASSPSPSFGLQSRTRSLTCDIR